MFQEAALFPWLTVRATSSWRCGSAACPRRERAAEADQLLHTVHLDGFGDKRPHELSGGMRQRVAIARAFAQEADILLMDEPFGALDAMTRDLLHAELERLWADRNLSVVFVTHNVREAARLADRVVLLSSRPGPGRERVRRRHRTASAHGLARGVEPGRRDHRRAASGGAPPCPRLTSTRPRRPARPGAGRPRRPRAGRQRGGRPLARRLWSAAWPKLAAIAHRPSRSGRPWSRAAGGPSSCSHRPRRCGTLCKEQAESGTLWTAMRTTLRRAAVGFAMALVIGVRRRRGRVAGEGAPRRVRLVHHRPADDAVDRVVPAGRAAVQADRGRHVLRRRARRRPVDRQRPHRRRRHPPAAAPCGPAGRWAPAA